LESENGIFTIQALSRRKGKFAIARTFIAVWIA